MEKIKKEEDVQSSNGSGGNFIDKGREVKKKITRNFMNNKGFLVGIILMFIVIVVYTTNINFNSAFALVKFGLALFVLIFCSYSMYVNCADSGTRAGKNSSLYTTIKDKYDNTKKKIKDNKIQVRLSEFCKQYIEEELQNTRDLYLTEVGLDYNQYKTKWLGKDELTINSDKDLSGVQKQAVIVANKIKPIVLTPDMIMKRERGGGHRKPLGTKPQTKKGWAFAIRFITTLITSVLTCFIALETIANPSWATFAEMCLKLLLIVLNGFTGYKMGYENIVIDTVNYMSDQIDLMEQFELYVSQHPIEKVETPNVEETTEEPQERTEEVVEETQEKIIEQS